MLSIFTSFMVYLDLIVAIELINWITTVEMLFIYTFSQFLTFFYFFCEKSECQPLAAVQNQGITFDEFVYLARCNGAKVQPYRYDQSNLQEFRKAVKQATFFTSRFTFSYLLFTTSCRTNWGWHTFHQWKDTIELSMDVKQGVKTRYAQNLSRCKVL